MSNPDAPNGARTPPWVIALFAVQMVSCAIFLFAVKQHVFDDTANLADATRYAREGLTADAMRKHINPPGPVSFYWMSLGARLFGEHLWAYRLPNWLSWLLAGGALLAIDRMARWRGLPATALAGALIAPHAAMTAALILTEGTAQLLGLTATFAFYYAVRGEHAGMAQRIAWYGLAGVAAGLAIVCRQYFAALLGAIGLWGFLLGASSLRHDRVHWAGLVLTSALGLLPLAALVSLWGGMASPGMVDGSSYDEFRASVGLSPLRPANALFYLSVYALPLGVGRGWLQGTSRQRNVALACAVLAAAGAAWIGEQLVANGPLRSVLQALFSSSAPRVAILSLLAAAGAFNLARLLQDHLARSSLASMTTLCWLSLAMFVVEQAAVGGNIPFYERYVFQAAPYLAVAALGAIDSIARSRIVLFVLLSALSHAMLWRFA